MIKGLRNVDIEKHKVLIDNLGLRRQQFKYDVNEVKKLNEKITTYSLLDLTSQIYDSILYKEEPFPREEFKYNQKFDYEFYEKKYKEAEKYIEELKV